VHSAPKAIFIRIFLLASPNTELLPVPAEVPLALRTKFSWTSTSNIPQWYYTAQMWFLAGSILQVSSHDATDVRFECKR